MTDQFKSSNAKIESFPFANLCIGDLRWSIEENGPALEMALDPIGAPVEEPRQMLCKSIRVHARPLSKMNRLSTGFYGVGEAITECKKAVVLRCEGKVVTWLAGNPSYLQMVASLSDYTEIPPKRLADLARGQNFTFASARGVAR